MTGFMAALGNDVLNSGTGDDYSRWASGGFRVLNVAMEMIYLLFGGGNGQMYAEAGK